MDDYLGLSPTDKELLINNVNIVFHSAATVAFNNPIKIAINTNILGTRRVLDLCREIKQLKVNRFYSKYNVSYKVGRFIRN